MSSLPININFYDNVRVNGLAASTTEYSRFHFPKHFHDHYTILMVEHGVNEGFTQSEQYKIGPGGLIVINPGDLHAGNSYQDRYLKFESIRIDQTFLKHFCAEHDIELSDDMYFDTSPIYYPALTDTMRGLIRNLQSAEKLGTEVFLTKLLHGLIQNHSSYRTRSNSKSDHRAIALAIEYMQANYKETIELKDIAGACHLSPFHFIRVFKDACGLSPMQYLRNVRVEKAKSLLKDHNVSRVAHEVGFYDHSHFLRHFRKLEGIKPSRLKKAH